MPLFVNEVPSTSVIFATLRARIPAVSRAVAAVARASLSTTSRGR